MIKKVKDWLGIEGVRVVIDLPETFSINDEKIGGSYTISTQSSQYLEHALITLKERYQRGRRKSKLVDEYVIGKKLIDLSLPIEKDELIHREFDLEFNRAEAPIDRFGKRNILFKGLASMAKLAKNAKSQYFIIVEITVKGNKLKPYAKAELVAK